MSLAEFDPTSISRPSSFLVVGKRRADRVAAARAIERALMGRHADVAYVYAVQRTTYPEQLLASSIWSVREGIAGRPIDVMVAARSNKKAIYVFDDSLCQVQWSDESTVKFIVDGQHGHSVLDLESSASCAAYCEGLFDYVVVCPLDEYPRVFRPGSEAPVVKPNEAIVFEREGGKPSAKRWQLCSSPLPSLGDLLGGGFVRPEDWYGPCTRDGGFAIVDLANSSCGGQRVPGWRLGPVPATTNPSKAPSVPEVDYPKCHVCRKSRVPGVSPACTCTWIEGEKGVQINADDRAQESPPANVPPPLFDVARMMMAPCSVAVYGGRAAGKSTAAWHVARSLTPGFVASFSVGGGGTYCARFGGYGQKVCLTEETLGESFEDVLSNEIPKSTQNSAGGSCAVIFDNRDEVAEARVWNAQVARELLVNARWKNCSTIYVSRAGRAVVPACANFDYLMIGSGLNGESLRDLCAHFGIEKLPEADEQRCADCTRDHGFAVFNLRVAAYGIRRLAVPLDIPRVEPDIANAPALPEFSIRIGPSANVAIVAGRMAGKTSLVERIRAVRKSGSQTWNCKTAYHTLGASIETAMSHFESEPNGGLIAFDDFPFDAAAWDVVVRSGLFGNSRNCVAIHATQDAACTPVDDRFDFVMIGRGMWASLPALHKRFGVEMCATYPVFTGWYVRATVAEYGFLVLCMARGGCCWALQALRP